MIQQLGSGKRARYLWLGLVVIVLIVAGAIFITRPSSGQARGGRSGGAFQGPQPVQAATAVRGDIPITLSALGTVTPLAVVTVQNQIAGQLVKLGFAEGQMVKKGDFLAQIDPRPYQVALEQAEGQQAHDRALLQQAKSDLARYQGLEAQHYVSAQQLADQEFLVQQYTGSVQSDQAQIDSAKLNLTYCHIVAPVSGRVGLRLVNLGSYVQVASPNGIVVVTELSPISVLFSLPEQDVAQVMQQMSQGAHLQATLYDSTNTNKLAVGSLTAVDNQVNTTTGTVQLRAVFDNKSYQLFPNQFVNVQLLVNTLRNAVVVPVAAVQHGVPGTFVYVVNSGNTVSLRKVTAGPADGDRIAVLSGLQPGERVVTDGAEQLRDGAKVMFPQAPAAVAQGATRQPRTRNYPAWKKHKRSTAPAAASG
ncbi:MAG: MdtA/MuxA family multidrug efflux RND transporter periplasmic adaptor subunit [Gammaproteobacteria bacterium]